MKVDLSEFRFQHCRHCKNCDDGKAPSCAYFITCIVDATRTSVPSHFEGKTEVDNKYAKLLSEYIKLVKHLGFDIDM